MLKKALFSLILLSFVFVGLSTLVEQSTAFAQPSIVITSPTIGDVWQIGSKHPISFNYIEANTGNSFRVILRNQNNWSTFLTNMDGQNGKALLEWKVPDYADVNDTWYIVVESADGKIKAFSKPFKTSTKPRN